MEFEQELLVWKFYICYLPAGLLQLKSSYLQIGMKTPTAQVKGEIYRVTNPDIWYTDALGKVYA